PEAIRAAATEADIVWLEWCTQHAVLATDTIDFGDRKVIVRLHSFEALDTPFPRQMFWGNVDHLVLVSDDIRTLLMEQNPHIAQQTDIRVIPNGIDC
ncbi:MAG TPA: glycosyl transferase family 1, partial [Alphaproteobacteria bacterium]|nr:glycosyl transferase family 1 [Alphaproteobacteria bacterium]